MTLSSASTLSDIKAEYADTCSYEEQGSTSLAKRFVTACRLLLLKLPKSGGHNGATVDMSTDLIHQQLQDAQQYVAAADSTQNRGGGVVHVDFDDYRT